MKKISWKRILILEVIFLGLTLPVLWDYRTITVDFDRTLSILRKIQRDALSNDRIILVKFDGGEMVMLW